MKKYYFIISVLLLGVSAAFAVEDMRFVTTLSAPLAVFDKVETAVATDPAKAKKATIGVTNSTGSFNTTLKLDGKKAHLRTLQLAGNTTIKNNSGSVTQWKTPKIAVKGGGSLTGKQLKATAFTFSEGSDNSVHTIQANNNVQVTGNIAAASGTATNSLNIANRNWYETVENVPTGGTATQWGSLTGGTSDSTKTYSNVLFYGDNSHGPRSGSSTSGHWLLDKTTKYSNCTAGDPPLHTDYDCTSGATISGTACAASQCGKICLYTPCEYSNPNYVFVQYKYVCTC